MGPACPGYCEGQKSSLRRVMMEWPNIVGQGMKVVIAGVGLGLASAFTLIGAGSANWQKDTYELTGQKGKCR